MENAGGAEGQPGDDEQKDGGHFFRLLRSDCFIKQAIDGATIDDKQLGQFAFYNGALGNTFWLFGGERVFSSDLPAVEVKDDGQDRRQNQGKYHNAPPGEIF